MVRICWRRLGKVRTGKVPWEWVRWRNVRFGLKVHSKQPCRQQFQKTRRTTMERDGCCCCCCWRSCRRGRVVGFALTVWWICLRFWLAGFVAPVEVTARSGHEVTLPCDVDVAACGGFHSIKWYRQAQRVFVYSELANLERSEGTLQNRSGPLSIYPSIRLSIHLSIYWSTYWSTYGSMYVYVSRYRYLST